MFISILIPVKGDNKNLRECVEECLQLDHPGFEIIVLPDEPLQLPHADKIRVIPTGPVGPARKRDMAVPDAKGGILAFLDDDAFPCRGWLKAAVRHFGDKDVAAVCGPAVTPGSDTLRQKASGSVYASFLVSGAHNRRYVPTKPCEVDDYPSCNFLVRKDVFLQAGGFDTKFWPGEDTILCLKITSGLKKKIIYDPEVLVYHHRRPLFVPHLRQIKSYALHRGYFVKKFPANSFKLSYFLPSLFVIGLAAGFFLSPFVPLISSIYTWVLSLYLALVFISTIAQKGVKLKALMFAGVILTHLCYGIYFIKGLLSRKLGEE